MRILKNLEWNTYEIPEKLNQLFELIRVRDDLTDIDIFSSYDDDNIFDLNNDAIIDLQNVLAAVGGAPAADAGPSLAAT